VRIAIALVLFASRLASADVNPTEPRPIADAVTALRDARAAGLKIDILVNNPVRCPKIAKPTGDFAKLGNPTLAIDPAGFQREDIGIAEAVALLGPPVLCSYSADFGHLDMYLATTAPNVRSVRLETHDDDLIGIGVDYDKPVAVDLAALAKRFGPARGVPGTSHGPRTDVFDANTPAFRAMLMFGRRDRSVPAGTVDGIIFRRTAMIAILPDKFQSAADLARLARLALRPRAPDTVGFYGTLGVFDGITGDRVAFRPIPEMRNVAHATIDKRTVGKRHLVRAVSATFAKPIAGDAAAVAAALPGAKVVAGIIQAPGGTITLRAAPAGGIAGIQIDRTP
jgi:hypothetical protein